MKDLTTEPGVAPATADLHGPPRAPHERPAGRRRRATGAVAIVAALAANLVILLLGRAAGSDFVYHPSGRTVTVDALSVTFMTVVPLAAGLVLTALLARRWPAVVRVALVAGPVAALLTIPALTLPAGFDTAGTVALSLMHVTLVPAVVVALTGGSVRR